MMNEPFSMPKPGETTEGFQDFDQDLTIWPTFALAGIKAIRAIDNQTLIYLGGNNWHRAWGLGTENPGFPLAERDPVRFHCTALEDWEYAELISTS